MYWHVSISEKFAQNWVNNLINPYSILQICDKLRYPIIVSIFGNTSMAIAFLFLGPVSFIPVETELSAIQGMVGLAGLGHGLLLASSFVRAQKGALTLGYGDNITTYLMISG